SPARTGQARAAAGAAGRTGACTRSAPSPGACDGAATTPRNCGNRSGNTGRSLPPAASAPGRTAPVRSLPRAPHPAQRDQLVDIDRLGDVIVGAGLQATLAIV